MDIGIVLTGLGTVVTIVGSNIALISWLRADMKSFETRIEAKVDSIKEEIQKESRDFHGRLCSLEARWHKDNHNKKNMENEK